VVWSINWFLPMAEYRFLPVQKCRRAITVLTHPIGHGTNFFAHYYEILLEKIIIRICKVPYKDVVVQMKWAILGVKKDCSKRGDDVVLQIHPKFEFPPYC